MNKKATILLILLLLSARGLTGGNGDSTAVRYSLPFIDFFSSTYAQPAASLWRPVRDKATVGTSYQQRHSNEYHLVREGSSGSDFGLFAEGIQREANTAFWGSTTYRDSRQNGVNWTEVNDLQRVGPYQVADSIGRNVFGEEYLLSGGFTSMKGIYNWAVEAGYRAANNHRKRDPRPRTIVSEPYLKVGFAMPAGEYRLGTTLSGTLYRQRLTVSIIEPKRKDMFFAMRGFGMYDRLQSDYDSSFGWLYEGSSQGVSLFLLPEKGSGWIGLADYRVETTESYSTGNMYPSRFRVRTLVLQAGHSKRNAFSSRSFKVEGELQRGSGVERVYEHVPVDDNGENPFYEYRLLSESTRYQRDLRQLKATLLQEWFRGNSTPWVGAEAGFRSYTEQYLSPGYFIEYAHLGLIASGGVEVRRGKSSVITSLEVGYHPLVRSDKQVPEGEKLYDASMAPDVEVLTVTPLSGACRVQYEYRHPKVTWFVSGSLSAIGVKERNSVTARLAAGIKL